MFSYLQLRILMLALIVPHSALCLCEGYMILSTVNPSLQIPSLHHILLPQASGSTLTPSDFYMSSALVCSSVIMWTGISLRILCFRTLGRHFMFELSINRKPELITVFPYNIVRHPAYLGGLVKLVGAVIARLFSRGTWWVECGLWHTWEGKVIAVAWMGVAVFIGWTSVARICEEDRMLEAEFGEQWRRWAQRTPYAMIPYVW